MFLRLDLAVLVALLSSCCFAGPIDGEISDERPEKRIVNGENAAAGEFPFVGLLEGHTSYLDGVVDGYNQCGGSIISDRIILTAAHCVVKDTPITDKKGKMVDDIYLSQQLSFKVGVTDLSVREETEQQKNIAGIIVHEEYNGTIVKNDIALLVLDSPIQLTDNVKTIALPETADRETLYKDGAACTVIGWGTTENGETSNELRKLPYTVSPKQACADNYGEQLLDGMMCTGINPEEKRAGTGDSGGPVFTKKEGEWVQIGLVSWGPPDITPTSYDVNADVLFYRDWIISNKDKAFTEYVTSLKATSSAQTVVLQNLRNYLYKTIKITPTSEGTYTRITIKSGMMQPFDFVMIVDGDDPNSNKMLAQLSGTLKEQTFTATSTKGLTIVIMTSKTEKSDGFTFEYSEVSDKGARTELTCSTGYTACKDNYYCLNNVYFCDEKEEAQCRDGSDEMNCPEKEDDSDGTEEYDDYSGSISFSLSTALISLLTATCVL